MNPIYGVPITAGLGATAGLMSPNQQAAYNQYAQTLQQLAQGYNPYIKAGQGALKGTTALGAANVLMPTLPENRMAATYSMSPSQQQIMTNTTNQLDANAAQTGMLGSTAQQAQLANQLAAQQNQWQQQYINRGEGQYANGEKTLWGLTGLGYNALGAQTGLEQEAALGTLRGGLAPTPQQNALYGGLGAAESYYM